MLLAVLLIPVLIAMAMLISGSASRVLVKVYVPCLMLVPVYMTMGLGGFLLSDTALVISLLCGVGLFRWYHTLRFTFVDACVLLFAFSAFYADAHQRPVTIGLYVLLQNCVSCVFPYFVGRTLIEQAGARRDFVKTLVFCLAVLGVVSLYEYRMEVNVFNLIVARITGGPVAWGLQTRWGFARISGPYTGPIVASMMFSTGLLLQLWLAGTKTWEGSRALRFFRASRRGKAVTAAVCLGLILTQSRGPWIGCVFGLIIASVGFAKNRRRAATIAIVGLAIVVSVTSLVLDKYTSEQAYTGTSTGDDDQQNAAYRRNLIPIYMPLIAVGGFWGWGTPQVHNSANGTEIGYIAGQTSIDNEFIRVAMAQGYFGASLFILILIASIYRTARLCASFRNRQDIILAYCLLGALLALAFSITTVALMDPMTQVAFLIFGWVQSLGPARAPAAAAAAPFVFKRVFA